VYKGGILDRFRAQSLAEFHAPKAHAQAAVIEALDRAGWDASLYMFPGFILLLLLPFLIFKAGRARQFFQDEYVVLEHPHPCIAVGTKDDRIICVLLDETHRSLRKAFFLLPDASLGEEPFKVVWLGRLRN
jgi:hypothetical protein